MQKVNLYNPHKPYGLISLLLANLKENIIKVISIKKVLPLFPKEIGDYLFIGEIEKEGLRKSYQIGLYQNKKGKKAVAKMISKHNKGYHYYSLLNEINTYHILYDARRRVSKKIPSGISRIIIPKPLAFLETDDYLIQLIEHFDGVSAEEMNEKEKVQIYFSVLTFLDFLGKRLNQKEKSYISKRTGLQYVMLYPLLVGKAILTYPKTTLSIIKGIPYFLKSIPMILLLPATTLSHRDLHFLNILVSKRKIAVIDLQQCVFTNSYIEKAVTLREVWKEGTYYKKILSTVIKNYSNNRNSLNLFRAFSINAATHALTGSGFPEKTVYNWSDFLTYCSESDFSKEIL
ncbi:MAG TPA: hypothetical protein VEW42_01520 [Candidatus Eisenbacteria bacterium]|nr:hypothetical protein [Candidatus Eisenbacteria bacterium]